MTTTFTFETAGASAPTLPDADPVVLEKNTQHVAEGISNLIEFFRHGPRNQAILTALLSQVQEAEDAAWQLYTERTLDVAEGVQLDVLGRIVDVRIIGGSVKDGQRIGGVTVGGRAGRSDEDYRTVLRATIMVNGSDGKPEQLIAIVKRMLHDSQVTLTENPPAAFTIEVSDAFDTATPQSVRDLLQRAKASGVRMDFVATDLDDAFVWSTEPAVSSSNGWAVVTGPDYADITPGSGGAWAQVL